MNPEFITVDSKLILKKGWIQENKLKTDSGYGPVKFFAFLGLVTFLLFSIQKITEEKKYLFIFQSLLIVIWMAPFLKSSYQFLFIKTWKSSIRLSEIKKVTTGKENELETKVILHLNNGRQKKYVFRNAENQAEAFLQQVSPASLQVVNLQ